METSTKMAGVDKNVISSISNKLIIMEMYTIKYQLCK